MVVPDRDDGCGLAKLCESRDRRELAVFRPEHRHVARVAVNVVAEEDEEVVLPCEHRLPDRLRFRLVGAAAEGDAAKRAAERRVRV
jgi:hypothetical protein